MAGTARRTRKTVPPNRNSSPLSEVEDSSSAEDNANKADNAPENDAANAPAPAPVVTMSVQELKAIQQQIADLQVAVQQNPRRRRRSDSDADDGPAPKRSNLRGKAPMEYWGEDHPKLDAFIQQCEENFDIDGCTEDKTRVAYAGSYCRGTPRTQWQEYKRRPEHRPPHVITWVDMKRELRRQLGEEHVYLNQMYEKWQRATQRVGQTGKEFGAYLQSIRTNLQELGEVDLLSEKLLLYHMRQGLRPEVRAALYLSPEVPKDWPAFLAAVARAESSIQEQQSTHSSKHIVHKKATPVHQATENDPNSSNHNNQKSTTTRGNSQARSRGRFGRGGRNGRGSYRGGKVSNNNTPASGVNNTIKTEPGNHSADTCYNCNKIGHWSNECPDLTPKN